MGDLRGGAGRGGAGRRKGVMGRPPVAAEASKPISPEQPPAPRHYMGMLRAVYLIAAGSERGETHASNNFLIPMIVIIYRSSAV